MIKLFKCANLFVRLCETKQCVRAFNLETINATLTTNSHSRNYMLWRKYSTTELPQINDTPENDGPDIEVLSGGNPEVAQKLKVLILETEVMRQEGRNVPESSFMNNRHWEELLKLPSRSSRRKYLEFLFKVEKKKENFKLKKEKKRLERETLLKPEIKSEDAHLTYGLAHNNIFIRFYDSTINNLYNGKLFEAMMFSQQLVIDCGYDINMTSRENVNCAKQLTYLFGDNRIHDDPFDLHFCNANKQSVLMKTLHGNIKTMYEPWFPMNIHEKSYCDIFPKEKLVYLTPHCREEMVEYDHDAIYIIGAIVDKTNNQPLSLAKAKKEGLRMMKLPLDKYLQWGAGSGKSLTLNQVVAILLDIRKTGDWEYALRHVPRRKIARFDETYSNINNARTLAYDKDDDDNRTIRFKENSKNFQRNFARHEKLDGKTNFRVKSIFHEE